MRWRILPSGLHQVTVDLPSGKRVTRSGTKKSDLKVWATKIEGKILEGQQVNPKGARTLVSAWHKKWWEARVVEPETRRGDETTWRLHVEPHWREWQIGSVGRIHVQAWVRTLEKTGVGANAIRHAYNLFAKLMSDAVLDGLIGASPCKKIDLPPTPPKAPNWFTRIQVDLIKTELPPGHAAMAELMVCTGLRWGEAAGTAGGGRDDETGNPIDWLRKRLLVRGSMSQTGKWKPYPKNSSSRREVPVPEHVLDELAPLLKGRARNAWVFVARRRSPGSPKGAEPPTLSGSNWWHTWDAAIKRLNARIESENKDLPPHRQQEPVPHYSPHDCRHTAASWLAQSGVPLYDIQALLGHSSYQTTQRYAHLVPGAHTAVESAWSRIFAHMARTGSL